MYRFINVVFVFLLFSCDSFLKEYSQDTVYVKTYQDLDELLLGQGYMKVEESNDITYKDYYFPYVHYMADEIELCEEGPFSWMYQTDLQEHIFGYFTWQQRVDVNETETGFLNNDRDWRKLYEHVNICNSIIEQTKELSTHSEKDLKEMLRVRGEAHFLRAAYYFILVNLYAKPYNPETADTDLGVPLKLTDYIEDKIFSRHSVQEVYKQIVSDLEIAEECFQESSIPVSLYRAGLTANNLLFSRVYLYMQNWEKAKEYAEKVMNEKPMLPDLNNLKGGFLSKNSIENIFSMGGHCLTSLTTYAYKGLRVSDELYDDYEERLDLRRDIFFFKFQNFIGYTKLEGLYKFEDFHLGPEYFYDYSYTGNYEWTRVEVSDNFLLRASEAYLNYAEASAYLGDEADALYAINFLREMRYIKDSDYKIKASGEELVKAIRKERKLELALEGHRWFDLRRYQVCSVLPESKSITHKYMLYEGRWTIDPIDIRLYTLEPFDAAYTLPIPHDVTDYNFGMKNNERPARTYVRLPLN